MSEWILAEDKLPPEYRWVLIYYKGQMHVGRISNYTWGKGGKDWWWGNDNYSTPVETGAVTHWAELPDPPE